MYKTISAPLVVQVEISAQCTNQCMHCYNFWRQNDKTGNNFSDLSIEKIDRIMDQLTYYRIFHIVFTGGEPFLNKRVLFRALEEAQFTGITTGINSNLIPITNEDAKRLKQLEVTNVLTSLMGPTSEIHDELAQHRGAFRKTVRGIRFLQEAGVSTTVNMVLSQKNKQFLKETALFVKSLGVKHFSSTRAGCPGNCGDFSEMSLDIQDFRDYLAELHTIGEQAQISVGVLESYPLCAIKEVKRYKSFIGRRCSAGVTTFTVATDGKIRPCSHLDVSYGNIFSENIDSIWSRMKEWRDGSLLPFKCRSCKILAWCGGGCRMEAKMRNGSFTTIDPYVMPQDLEYTVSEFSKINRKTLLPLPPIFRLNPMAKWRLEEFGAVVFVGQRFRCYLNVAAVELLQNLRLNQIYQINDFNDKVNGDLEGFLRRLYNYQIILK